MKTPNILGHIDCPTCGTKAGMRITRDKNGDPFGYCEAECSQQMRIGGDARRVRKFVERHPWAAREDAAPVPEQASKPAAAPVPAAAAKPVAPRSSMADALHFLGVRA